jgi:hypothetical protein
VVRPGSGDGPLSVRERPSTVKGTRRSILTASQKPSSGPALERRCLAPLRSETQGPGRSLPGPDAGHRLHAAGQSRRAELDARCVPDRPSSGYLTATNGQPDARRPAVNSSRHRHSRPPSKGWPDRLSDPSVQRLINTKTRRLAQGVWREGTASPVLPGPGAEPRDIDTPAACAARGKGSPCTPSPATGTAPIGWRPGHATSQHAGTKAQLKAAEEP